VTSPNPSPDNDLFAAASISAIDIWAVGFMQVNGAVQTLTENRCAPPSVSGVAPNSGSGGTTVVITGSGFSGAVDVQFGGSRAFNFQVDSDTQIRATSPGHRAGTVDITVTVQGTSAQSSADHFTYVERSGVSPASSGEFRTREPPPPSATPATGPASADVAVASRFVARIAVALLDLIH
jgi:IPT/TIG domain-containing protein